MKETLSTVFKLLDTQIINENKVRRLSGAPLIARSQIEILGQTSLLIQPELTYGFSLVQTGDLDALLRADHFVKQALKKIFNSLGKQLHLMNFQI